MFKFSHVCWWHEEGLWSCCFTWQPQQSPTFSQQHQQGAGWMPWNLTSSSVLWNSANVALILPCMIIYWTIPSLKELNKRSGVVMTPLLSKQEHIAHITERANFLLGFIFRSSKNFRSTQTLIASLIRSIFGVWVGHLIALSAGSHYPSSTHTKQVFQNAWSKAWLPLPHDSCQWCGGSVQPPSPTIPSTTRRSASSSSD